ncbi:MAG: NifB/NifX family molybdenum-iron cluster-binding protein [Chloroflexi bacterium]|nr:NifB/NifX family molybdenum-iron cluster-binding protein [Chloroflexota bacterium]
MKVAISCRGSDLEAAISPIFGRCETFLLVDTETMQVSALPNPACGAPGGAGVQAAQFVLQHGAEAVISGNVGPNALQVFDAAGVPVYSMDDGTARQAVEALKAGALQALSGPTVSKDYGKGGSGMRRGGRGLGRGMGWRS